MPRSGGCPPWPGWPPWPPSVRRPPAHRAFARLVRRDVEALHARAFPGPGGVVTEEMLEDLPEPVRRYLRYTGVVGKPFPGTIRLRQKGRMRLGPGQMWLPAGRRGALLGAAAQVSCRPARRAPGPLAVARARDMYAEGTGQMLVKVASLWPVVDASGEQMNQAEMLRYLNEMIWFPAAFLAANISFEPAGDSSARVTLTDNGRAVTGTMFFDQQGRLTDFVAQRYRTPGASDPDTWSTPVTGYGGFEGLRLPATGKAIYKLPGGDLKYIKVTLTELHYDTGAAVPEGRT